VDLFKGDFLKSLVVLLSGTVIAQVLNIAFMPIISRVYTPDEVGFLNFYLQIVTFITVVATLRMELAIPLEKEDSDRYTILRFASRFAVLFSAISLFFVPFLSWKEDFSFALFWVALFIPLGALLHALFNIGMYWSLAQDAFKTISAARLIRSFSTNSLKVIFGFLNFGGVGLIVSVLIGMFAAVAVYAKDVFRVFKLFPYKKGSVREKELMHKHRDFRLFNLPHVLVDLTRDLVLASIIVSFCSTHDYGSFSQAYIVLRLPLMFVGEAIGQALFAKLIKLIEANQKIGPGVLKLVAGLSLVSFVPFWLVSEYGVELFQFFLGADWCDAGRYAEVIAWWSMVLFVVSPISFLPIVLKQQGSYFALNIIRTLCLILATVVPIYLNNQIPLEDLLEIVALTQIGINLLLLVYYGIIIRRNDKKRLV
jgi:O-antigen/teichoic acid export membrane protein